MDNRVSLLEQRVKAFADQARRLSGTDEELYPAQIEAVLASLNEPVLESEGVYFSPVPIEPDVDYGVEHNWIAKIVEYLQRMIGSADPMTKADIIESLGRVIYIPQARTFDYIEDTETLAHDVRHRTPMFDRISTPDYLCIDTELIERAKPRLDFPFNSACFETTGAVSIAGSIFVNTGDWMLGTVVASSDISYPEGWTVLHESTALNTGHRMAFICKQSTIAGVDTVTVVQDMTGEMFLNVIAVPNINGFTYSGKSSYYDTTTYFASHEAQKSDGLEVIWGCFAAKWSSNSHYQQWQTDDVVCNPLDIGIGSRNKQANFYDNLSGSQRTFATTIPSPVLIDCVEIVRER